MNSRQRKTLKVAAAGMMLCFSMTTTAVMSFAWFQATRKQDTGGSHFSVVSASDLKVEYKIYGYDDDIRNGREIDYENDPLLEQYDSFILERNAHNNRIIQVDITILTTLNSSAELLIGATSTSEALGDDGYINRYISNILYFKGVLADYSDASGTKTTLYSVDASTDATLYSDATSVFAQSAFSEQTFVSTAAANYTKTAEFDIKGASNNAFTVPAGTKQATIYLEYNYCDALILKYENEGKINDTVWGTTDILQGNTVNFANDIPYLRVRMAE